MDYYFNFCIFIILCSSCTYPSQTISTNKSKNNVRAIGAQEYYRHKPLAPDKTNWEMGLREATYQALMREQVPDPALRTGIYAADIEGLQDTATPFGDIALVARGQLFATAHGYHFVQDPYHSDCEDCDKHNVNPRCGRRPCLARQWTEASRLDNLMALWTVKRIRHRDSKLGHRYELQFTIAPMSPAANPHFVARNGRFDYNVPGHVFIVKLRDATETTPSFRFDKEHRSSNHQFKVLPWSHNIDQLYQQHHGGATPLTPNSIAFNTDYFAPPPQKATPAAATTEHQQHVYNPGFLIGISPNGYKHILHDLPGFVGERPPYLPPPRHYIPPTPTPPSTPKEPIKHLHHHFYIPNVEDIDYEAKKMLPTPKHQPPITTYIYTAGTTQHQASPVNTHPYPDFQTTITQPPTLFKFYTVTESGSTVPPAPFSPSPFYFQYSEPDPIYNHSPAPTSPTFITTHNVVQPTAPTFVSLSELEEHSKAATLVGLFDEVGYTVQTSTAPPPHTLPAVKKHRKQKYPDSINAQLPPPDRNTDTTVPYVASTAVTFVSTPSMVTSSPHFDYTAGESFEEKGEKSEERKASTIQEQQITLIEKIHSQKKTTPNIELVTATTIETTTGTPASSTEQDLNTNSTTADVEIFSTTLKKATTSTALKDEQLDVELFGSTKRTTASTRATAQPGTTAKNAFDEIFSSTEQPKRFLTPHTQLSINNTDALRNARISKYLKYKKSKTPPHRERFSLKMEKEKRQKEAAEENTQEAKTSQSFITSISFKVNKGKNHTKDEDAAFHIHEIQKPNTSTDRAQTFDDVAHTLVKHARIEAYLNAKRRRAVHHK